MKTVTINGIVYNFNKNLVILDDTISIDNVIIETEQKSTEIKIDLSGDPISVYSYHDIYVYGNVIGAVEAAGSVTMDGGVGGNVESEGNVKVGDNVGKDVSADGNVEVGGDIAGNVKAKEVNVTGNVVGNVKAEGNVNVTGSVSGKIVM